jgi:glycine betaine/choline ABC-type transport system substrate-binding protein
MGNEMQGGWDMRRAVLLLCMVLFIRSGADACVGKTLVIGAVNTPQDRILAEMLSVMITERTGTTITVRYFSGAPELYAAVEKSEIGIVIENTDRGMELVGRPKDANGERAYVVMKEEFRKRYNLVCLQPVGSLSYAGGTGRNVFSPAITVDAMNNFPALPRVINKLAGVMNDEGYGNMIRSVEAGEKPGKAAREFLKSKKFI